MKRLTVLHCARDWVRPSESFVAELVGSTTATRAVVACGRRWPDSPADRFGHVRVRELGRWAPQPQDRPRDRRVLRAALAALATAERAAVLHAHFGYWGAHVGRTAGRLGLPWVLSLHGHDLLVEDRHQPERDVLRTATLVVVPSSALADAASGAGFPDERIRVIPSGVDLSRLPFRERTARPDGEVVVTVAGRYVEKKGVLDAARALAAAAREVPGLRAVFVGHGPLEAQLREQIAASGLPAELRDGTRPGAVAAALAENDLAVVASRTAADGDMETLGLVAIEAQACGVPLVATRHGGLVEAVAPDAGLLVAEGDVAALTAAVTALAADPGHWPAMGRAGRRHAALRFELGTRVADVEEQYAALARTGAAGPPPPAPRTGWPRIRVVMVTHDRRALVRETVAALAAQTYPAELVEHVVVDNACTDGTGDDLAAAPHLRVIRADRHLPPAEARNRAVAGAGIEIVAFTDDDCVPVPTWLEALAAGMRAGVGIVQGRTAPDPAGWIRPLSRTQWTPAEYGLYETANVAYDRAVLGDAPFDEAFAAEVADVLGRRFGRYPFGEDTELAWRVKRAGVATRFAPYALVHHHVYEPDPPYLLRRAVLAAAFPVLVRRVPELREVFLHRGFLLGPRHTALLAATAGLALAPVDRRAGAAVLPWLWQLLRPTRPGRRERLRALPVLAARDVVELAALTYGTVRARRVVL